MSNNRLNYTRNFPHSHLKINTALIIMRTCTENDTLLEKRKMHKG